MHRPRQLELSQREELSAIDRETFHIRIDGLCISIIVVDIERSHGQTCACS
jgi:hypothetical protein